MSFLTTACKALIETMKPNSESELTKEVFNNFKEGFINKHFQDFIFFSEFTKVEREVCNFAPQINVWTSQPEQSMKTQHHL